LCQRVEGTKLNNNDKSDYYLFHDISILKGII